MSVLRSTRLMSGMRDQPPLRIDDIGMTTLAHLDLRDHVPDQLEIDLGHTYPGVTSGAGYGERHVRLGFPAEIDRSIVDFASHRLGELWFLRKVSPARHHVHGEARHPQPLLAARIELGQFGDSRHLSQQP